jgi:glucose/arabinose dehydrogenase
VLTFERNLITLRAFQNDGAPTPPNQGDETQPPRGNYNGGVIRFGPDRELYIQIGDNGRRGQLQNLRDGPTGPGQFDDQFGGPEPDDAHLTGVILRLNDDGTAPADNPFIGASVGGNTEVRANVQKIFAHGIRRRIGPQCDGTLFVAGARPSSRAVIFSGCASPATGAGLRLTTRDSRIEWPTTVTSGR